MIAKRTQLLIDTFLMIVSLKILQTDCYVSVIEINNINEFMPFVTVLIHWGWHFTNSGFEILSDDFRILVAMQSLF